MTGTSCQHDFVFLSEINKHFHMGANQLHILRDVSLTINSGESVAILGPSGSGKSTLLNLLGLLDSADTGQYRLGGHETTTAAPDQLASIRNQLIGFVFQSFNLMPRLTALENVALPLGYRGVGRADARHQAMRMLEQVGLAPRAHHRPADLSGGQRQRVAIARALVGKPRLILADEPTGNLDGETAKDIMALLLSLNREYHVTLIVVTHDPGIATLLNRQIQVDNGVVRELCPCSA
ncbi:ABC transporter ATP-binding protein [Pseudomonas sp. PB3P13]